MLSVIDNVGDGDRCRWFLWDAGQTHATNTILNVTRIKSMKPAWLISVNGILKHSQSSYDFQHAMRPPDRREHGIFGHGGHQGLNYCLVTLFFRRRMSLSNAHPSSPPGRNDGGSIEHDHKIVHTMRESSKLTVRCALVLTPWRKKIFEE